MELDNKQWNQTQQKKKKKTFRIENERTTLDDELCFATKKQEDKHSNIGFKKRPYAEQWIMYNRKK